MHEQALSLPSVPGHAEAAINLPEMPSLSVLAREFLSNLPELLLGGSVNNARGDGGATTNTPEIGRWK